MTGLRDLAYWIPRNWIDGDLKEFVFEYEGIDKAYIRVLPKRQSLEQTFQHMFHLSAWVQGATRQNMCNETIFDQEEKKTRCCYMGLGTRHWQRATHSRSGWGRLHNRMSRTNTATGALEDEYL